MLLRQYRSVFQNKSTWSFEHGFQTKVSCRVSMLTNPHCYDPESHTCNLWYLQLMKFLKGRTTDKILVQHSMPNHVLTKIDFFSVPGYLISILVIFAICMLIAFLVVLPLMGKVPNSFLQPVKFLM